MSSLPNWLFPLLAILCLFGMIVSAFIGIAAAADAEGRGGNIALLTLAIAALLFVAFVVLSVISYSKFFGS